MKYKRLGRTGLYVSELCLGTMTLGGNADAGRCLGQTHTVALCLADLIRIKLESGRYQVFVQRTENLAETPPAELQLKFHRAYQGK